MKTVEFITAQHVKIEYELASTGMRVAASLIDLFVFFIYFMFTGFLFGNAFLFFEAGISELISLILIQLPWYFYSPIIEYFTNGQSVGKYTLGIRVVSISGENATLREYFTRWVFRIVDLWFGFGFLAILFSSSSPRAQRLGDVMANTVIIRKKSTVLYSLRNILSIKQQENHEPTYPNVIRFTDEDVMLIKTTIQRVEKYPTDEMKKFAIELANKTAELIDLPETPDKKLTFLKTVLLDYVVLTR